MAHRKTLSLSEGDMQKLNPILKRHNGNFSAAVRELVFLGDTMISRFGSIESALHELHPRKSLLQQLVENRYGILLPYSLVQWGLKLLEGFLPPKGSLETPMHDSAAQTKGIPAVITEKTCSEWEKLLNELYPQLGWEVKITLEPAGTTLMVTFSGLNPEVNHLAQMVLSFRLASQNPPYKIEEMREYLPLVTIYYRRCNSQKEALERLEHIFHYQKNLYELLQEKRSLLSKLVLLLKEFNYDVTILPSEYMEDLLGGHFSTLLLKSIQRHAGKSVSELSQEEFLKALEEINENFHLYEKMERENHRIVFFHSIDDPDSVKKLADVLSDILYQANLAGSFEIAENMLVFRTSPVRAEKPKLLIGEEELDSLLSLKYELEQDYAIIDAQDGAAVLEKAQEKPEVILLNMTLSKMGGVEVLSKLKREKSTSTIPVILVVPEGISPEQVKEAGADECIVKPFEIDALKKCIEAQLKKR